MAEFEQDIAVGDESRRREQALRSEPWPDRAARHTECTAAPGVVRLIARLNVGGPAQHVTHLTLQLSSRYRTHLLVGRLGAGEADMSEAVIRGGGAVVTIPELGRALHPLSDLVALIKIVRFLRREKPLIVHTHTAKAGALGRVAAWIARVPIRVHTFHGHVFHGYFSAPTTRFFIWIERLLARITTRIVAISDTQADELSEVFRICDRSQIEVIPLGLDLDRFRGQEDEGSAFRREIGAVGRPVVTTVGRLVPIKNQSLFLDAAAALRDRGVDALFVIVGGGPGEDELRQRARTLGLQDRVRFLGWREDLPRIYVGTDVVVLTSDNEGTPVSLIEALAASRAVVATDVGGVRDVLDNGRLGVLVPPRDRMALAEAIGRLLADDDERSRLRAGGARSALARYSVDRLVESIDGLYARLLAEQQS